SLEIIGSVTVSIGPPSCERSFARPQGLTREGARGKRGAGPTSRGSRAAGNALLSDRPVGKGTEGGGRSGLMGGVRSWRPASVLLLSFSSGLPLGLVLIALP